MVREGRSFMTTVIVLRSFGVRRAVPAFAALAVILAVFPLVELTTAIPAGAAPGLLSCNGSTIYSVERGSSAGSTGTLNALTASTVGGASVTATAVSPIPAGGDVNALGITRGGTAAYVINQTTTAPNSEVIHHYDALTGTWNTFTGSSNVSGRFVAAAVDPVNGIYYYASFAPGTASTPPTATIYGFNTITNTAIPGVIGTMALGDGNSALAQNGDIAFDAAGNMYLLSSNAVNAAINIVRGPVPTTGSAGGVRLTSTLLTKFASTAEYVGIAFDNVGNLFVEDFTSSNVSQITKLNPNNGATVAGPTPLSANAQAFMNDDIGSCSFPPAPVPGISVVKSASPSTFSRAGQTITYHFLVTNTGNDTLTGDGVTDKDLPGLSAILCPQSTLAAGASEVCTATYVTTQANVNSGKVTNAATAHGLPPGATTPLVSAPSTATVTAKALPPLVPVTG
jgi:uncharacterized repeat protein (TIGR01451 family)